MYALIFIINLVCCFSLYADLGYISVPVADLIAEPFKRANQNLVKESYESISVSPEQGRDSCLRVHQALFNEAVEILAYKNDQVQIILKNCISKSMMGLYDEPMKVWTLKDWVITQDELDDLQINPEIFPKPYSEAARFDESIITLMYPWYDDTTQITYSAGTRFCLSMIQTLHDHYAITLYDPLQKKSVLSYVPKSGALRSGFYTPLERRKLFVNLLYAWCTTPKSIPFVWGGTSFIDYAQGAVTLKTMVNNGVMTASWNCPYTEHPFSGFDASGLILRAAQICGIDYYCSNSRTVANMLSMIPFQEMQEGDILWAPGYVGIISSLHNNEIIEAQGYARGYGVVHCISLKNRFATIQTWDDFMYCCENKIPLQSLDSQGRCVAHIPLFRVYRLPC